jgi:hypothetical protein
MYYVLVYKRSILFNFTPFITAEQLLKFVSAYDLGESEVFLSGKTYSIDRTVEVIIFDASKQLLKSAGELYNMINPTALSTKGSDSVRLALDKVGREVTHEYIHGKYGHAATKAQQPQVPLHIPPHPEKKAVRRRRSNQIAEDVVKTPLAKTTAHRKIFISHSSRDKDIVNMFCKLIFSAALNINLKEDVFNTSLIGSAPKSGEDFRVAIKDHLIHAELVLQFISQNYKKSEVCLNEMGAAWVLNNTVVPMIIEDKTYDVGFINSTAQQVQLHDFHKFMSFVEDHKHILQPDASKISMSIVADNAREFVEWLVKHEGTSNRETKEHEPQVVEVAKNTPSTLDKIKHKFIQLDEHERLYFRQGSELREIPDNATLFFLGYDPEEGALVLSSEQGYDKHVGKPLESILGCRVLVQFQAPQPRTYWLIYENLRHAMDSSTLKRLIGMMNKGTKGVSVSTPVSKEKIDQYKQGNKVNFSKMPPNTSATKLWGQP